MKIENFKELKDYLNTRDDSELIEIPLGVQRVDEWYYKIPSLWILEEPHYQSEEGIDPVSSFDGDPSDEEDVVEQFEIYPIGYIFFDASDVDDDEIIEPILPSSIKW